MFHSSISLTKFHFKSLNQGHVLKIYPHQLIKNIKILLGIISLSLLSICKPLDSMYRFIGRPLRTIWPKIICIQ